MIAMLLDFLQEPMCHHLEHHLNNTHKRNEKKRKKRKISKLIYLITFNEVKLFKRLFEIYEF